MRRRHRRAHLRTWMALAFLLPLVLLAAPALRHNGALASALVRLSELAR